MTGEYKPVPVDEAKQIARKYDKNIVVVICWDRLHGRLHTTTYGVSAADKVHAASAGDIATLALGGDLSKSTTLEDFRLDFDAASYKLLLEQIERCRTADRGGPENVEMRALYALADDIADEKEKT